MRSLFFLAAAAAGFAAPSGAFDWMTLRRDMEISAPRIALADLDGDGDAELAVGGRTGSFSSRGGHRSARLEVLAGASSAPVAASTFDAVRDMAGADLDGDGREELVVAGGRGLVVLNLRDGSLLRVPQTGVPAVTGAAGERVNRVDCMDVDGDGEVEVAWTGNRWEPSGEGGAGTVLRVASVSAGGFWRLLSETRFSAHVGDLCFADLDGDGRGELVVETGVEEIGGRLDLFAVTGSGPEPFFSRPADGEARRLLSLAPVREGSGDLVVAATVDGAVTAFTWRGREFQGVNWRLPMERGTRVTGIAAAGPGAAASSRGLELLIGCSEPDRASGALVAVSGLHR